MANIDIHPPLPSLMKLAQMGECTNLWSELIKSPQCVIGGFTLNLVDLRRLTGDTATMSIGLDRFLDNCLYVKDSNENPDELSVSELYRANTNIEVVFDPLRSVELDWTALQNLLTRADGSGEFSTVNYEEMLDQMETRITLFANRTLQRKLVKCLKERQKEYLRENKWYHFHERFQDFWKVAYQVCLGKSIDSSVAQRGAQVEMLDWIFLSNDNNRTAYQRYIHTRFESKLRMSGTLDDLYALTQKLDQIVGKDSRGKDRPAGYKNTIIDTVLEIAERWNDIWEMEHRPVFDTPLSKNFRENMAAIDTLILNELIPLSTSNRKFSPKTHAETFGNLRDLLWTALESWKNLVKLSLKNPHPADPMIAELKQDLDAIIDYMASSIVDISESNSDDSAE